MPECVADLRVSASSESNDAPLDIGRGIKRKLDNSQEDQEKSQEFERIENPSAPKRRRRSKEGIVYKAKSSISSLFQSKYKSLRDFPSYGEFYISLFSQVTTITYKFQA